MAEEKEEKVESLQDIKKLGAETDAPVEPAIPVITEAETPVYEQKLDDKGRAYGTGRRKQSVARVWLKPGSGKVIVNGEDQVKYFARPTQRLIINQPFLKVDRVSQFDVVCTVKGGGLSGQAGAVRHGIARALVAYEPELRPTLKAEGMLTRDSRRVERKKYGKHKARRGKQWAKR